MSRREAVVVGTSFGRVHLAGLADASSPVRLVGVLARGSARSAACAEHYDVPLLTDLDQVPATVDVACVVVNSAVNGGAGTAVTEALLDRGIHVLQEHPVHVDDVRRCLRLARRSGVVYATNTLHVHTPAVRRFVEGVTRLRELQQIQFIDIATSFQLAFTMVDILERALGGLRPFDVAIADAQRTGAGDFRVLLGQVRGIPLTLRVQHQLDPRQPDNHSHLWHRATVGAEGGTLTLVDSTGPVVWCPRTHMPPSSRSLVRFDEADADHLDQPSATVLGAGPLPTWRQVLASIWPAAVRSAVADLLQVADDPSLARIEAQRELARATASTQLSRSLGPPTLVERNPPQILGADAIAASDEVPTAAG